MTTIGQAAWGVFMITIRCNYCKKDFKCRQDKPQKYCSRKCFAKAKTVCNHNFICQHCGKEFIESHYPGRNPKFCNRKCFIEHNQIKKKCLNCNKEFTVQKSQNNRKFCSQTCSNRYNQPKNPDKKSVFICKECGKRFETWVYRNPNFCSRKCTNRNIARLPKPSARKPEIHITRNCLWCNKEYKTTTHQVKHRGSNYCSMECKTKHKSETMKGEGNPNYVDGSSPQNYGPNWWKQRRKARRRDKNTCVKCGAKHNIKNGIYVDVHHKIPLRLFNGDFKSANNLNNLVCLCRKCHREEEIEFRDKEN